MLFDSGAATPVWCMGENKLKRAYPEAISKNENCYISGFGKEAIEGNLAAYGLYAAIMIAALIFIKIFKRRRYRKAGRYS